MATRLRGVSLDESMDILGVAESLLNTAREDTKRWPGRLSGFVCSFPGTTSILKRLQSLGYRLGTMTNRLRSDLYGGGAVQTLLSLSDVTVCVDGVGQGKPHLAPVLYAIRVINGIPKRTLHVGDTAIDVEAGCWAGCWPVLVNSEDPTERRWGAYSPHLAVTSLKEVANMLARPGQPLS